MRKIDMKNIREILRLHFLVNLSARKIQGATRVARTTIQEYIKRCKASDINSYEMLTQMSDDTLNEKLFGKASSTLSPNTAEGFNRQIRKITKTKGGFNSDDSLYKLVFFAYSDIAKKWKKSIPNWAEIISQLSIIFDDRLNGFMR